MHSSDIPPPHEVGRRYVFTKGFFAPYFVYERDAAPSDSVPVLLAASSAAAVQEITTPCGPAFVAPLLPGAPRPIEPDRMADPWRAVGLSDGRRLLVGRSRWPSDTVFTHSELWTAISPRIRAKVHLQWDAVHWEELPEAEDRRSHASGEYRR